jgi:hypothetical protein
MDGQDFSAMNGPQLVEWFNAAVQEQPIKGFKPVTRFGSREKGIARCQALLAAANGHALPQQTANRLLGEVTDDRPTVKNKVMRELIGSEGRPIAATALAKIAYGKIEGKEAALDKVIGGINQTLKKKKLNYIVRLVRNEGKERSFGLYTTQ